mgnify:CR=1 FL=1
MANIEIKETKDHKKVLSLVMAAIVLVTALGFNASPTEAAGTIPYAEGRVVWRKGVDGEFWVSHGPVGELECGMPPQ